MSVTKMSSYIYAVISCISFTTLCYAMLFNLNDKLWDLNAKLWDLNAMLWDIEIKNLVICYAMIFKKKYASIH